MLTGHQDLPHVSPDPTFMPRDSIKFHVGESKRTRVEMRRTTPLCRDPPSEDCQTNIAKRAVKAIVRVGRIARMLITQHSALSLPEPGSTSLMRCLSTRPIEAKPNHSSTVPACLIHVAAAAGRNNMPEVHPRGSRKCIDRRKAELLMKIEGEIKARNPNLEVRG